MIACIATKSLTAFDSTLLGPLVELEFYILPAL